MSQGRFSEEIYEGNTGSFHSITVQPETLALEIDGTANTPGTGPIDSALRASVTQGNNAYGLKARRVSFAWTGTPPANYDPRGRITLPILTPALYNSILPGSTGTYLGAAINNIRLLPERLN
jgi:hypothetical protein